MLGSPSAVIPTEAWDPVGAAMSRLVDGLVGHGHEVTVFAGSWSEEQGAATVRPRPVGGQRHAYPAQHWQHEVDHVARVLTAIDAAADHGRPFDLVHDHGDFAAVALADRIPIPLVHTLHGPITAELADLYARHSETAHLVATSEGQRASFPADLRTIDVVPDPVDVGAWPFQPHKEGYLLWVGGFDDLPAAGEVAAAARAVHVPLIIHAPVHRGRERFFDTHVAPHLDDDQVRYVGEGPRGRQQQLIADASALLLPARRRSERHRQLVLGALAAGTPVIAFAASGVGDVVRDGVNGYLLDHEAGLRAAMSGVRALDPAACRASVDGEFDVETTTRRYERIYQDVVPRVPAP